MKIRPFEMAGGGEGALAERVPRDHGRLADQPDRDVLISGFAVSDLSFWVGPVPKELGFAIRLALAGHEGLRYTFLLTPNS